MEEMPKGRDRRGGHGASIPSPGALPSQQLDVLTNPEALQAPSFRGLTEVPLHGHDWLNLWASVIISSPLSSAEFGNGTESPNLQIMFWSFSSPVPILKLSWGPQPLVNSLAYKRYSYHSRGSKNFRSCVPGIRNEDQIRVSYLLQWLTSPSWSANINYFRTVKTVLKDK